MEGVEGRTLIQGRWWSREELQAIRVLVEAHPGWSRWQLSRVLSEQFGWRTATGQLRDMAARHLLQKLAERGWLELPARRAAGGKQRLRALSEPDQAQGELFTQPAGPEVIEQGLRSLRPLEILLLAPGHPAATDFVRHLARHHYLGYGGDTGASLRYLVRDREGRDLACALFGAAAWQVRARDEFIGWSAAQRRERLSAVVNNTRFLILPHVRVPHLASHLLGLLLRRLAGDWEQKYALRPVLAESFVERARFLGTCYQAANWQCVGQSSGRGRGDRTHRAALPIKDIYLYPLRADFRAQLCAT